MNPLKSVPAAAISLIVLGVAAFFLISQVNNGEPGTSSVRALVQKEMERQFEGCVIKSISITRGGMFPYQGHQGMAGYGTPIYPTVVRVIYTVPLPDGSVSEERKFRRVLFLYKNSSHEWVNDTQLN